MEKGIFEKGYKTALLIAGITALLAFVKGVEGYFTNSLISNHINALITKEIEEIAFHRLRDEGIEIFLAEDDVDSLAKKFIEGRVKKLNKPTKMKG